MTKLPDKFTQNLTWVSPMDFLTSSFKTKWTYVPISWSVRLKKFLSRYIPQLSKWTSIYIADETRTTHSIHWSFSWAPKIIQWPLNKATITLFRGNQVWLVTICLWNNFPYILQRKMSIKWKFPQSSRELVVKNSINPITSWSSEITKEPQKY